MSGRSENRLRNEYEQNLAVMQERGVCANVSHVGLITSSRTFRGYSEGLTPASPLVRALASKT